MLICVEIEFIPKATGKKKHYVAMSTLVVVTIDRQTDLLVLGRMFKLDICIIFIFGSVQGLLVVWFFLF